MNMVELLNWTNAFHYISIGIFLMHFIFFKSFLITRELGKGWQWLNNKLHCYRYFEIPQFCQTGIQTETPLYRKAFVYATSLPSKEDSFLGTRLSWITKHGGSAIASLALRVRSQDQTRVLHPYLQYVESVFDNREVRRKNLRLFINSSSRISGEQIWENEPFDHPATLDTMAMDPGLKSRIQADLESFSNGGDYYRKIGRVWKRSYLLYGATGTGKSSFAAAMASFLGFDMYDFDLTGISRHEMRDLLTKTTNKSLILIENLDRHLKEENVLLVEMLNFMDGVFSCCGEEWVMVFTMTIDSNGRKFDPSLLRSGRFDVHIHFPLCNFERFKTLAANFLRIKDHELFPRVEEELDNGGRISPAEVARIMIDSRHSPCRAIWNIVSVIKAKSMLKIIRREDRKFGGSGRLNIRVNSKRMYGLLLKIRSGRKELQMVGLTPVCIRRGSGRERGRGRLR